MKVYLLSAVEGAYGAFEREDYFTQEELRTGPGSGAGLPLRLQGRDADVVEELLSRAPHVVVTAPAADRTGLLVADIALLGEEPAELPDIPAGSRLELPGATPYLPTYEAASLGEPTAEFLRHYRDCALRAWGHRVLPRDEDRDEVPEWLALRHALLSQPLLEPERLARLALDFPEAAGWLAEHEERLLALRFGQRLNDVRTGVVATIHAGERVPLTGRAGGRGRPAASQPGRPSREKIVIYRFVEPNPGADWRWAMEQLRDRWSEYLAAEVMLRNPDRAPAFVEFVVLPMYGSPIVVENSSKSYARSRIEERRAEVRVQAQRFAAGDVTPTPGFVCRDCDLAHVCRMREQA